MGLPSEYKRIVKAAKRQGWTIEYTRNNHLKWTPPSGGSPIFTGSSPKRDDRSFRNTLALLKKAGLII